MKHELCPDVCERPWWQQDPAFPNLGDGGQWNCPFHWGVTYASATIDGKPVCKHFKRKKVD